MFSPIVKVFEPQQSRSIITIHIADLHFGAIDPKTQFDIYKEQIIDKVANLDFKLFCINGDTFDHQFLANTDAVLYATMLVDTIVELCRTKNATFVILLGTKSHDADQLKLFYHYLNDQTIDIRIIETMQFIYAQGMKILCIPEEYGKGLEYYENFFYMQGFYDMAIMHGTIKGSVYGKNEEDLDSKKAPVFSIKNFNNCLGPIMSGHVHVAGCYNSYLYYTGSPIRWCYGEEASKGFGITLYNIDTHEHYMHFQEVTSFRYDTVNLDYMLKDDPRNVIEYIKSLQANGISHVRVEFTMDSDAIAIIQSYFQNNRTVKFKIENNIFDKTMQEAQKTMDKYTTEYNYLLDNELNEYQKLTMYINANKGYKYITTEELLELLQE